MITGIEFLEKKCPMGNKRTKTKFTGLNKAELKITEKCPNICSCVQTTAANCTLIIQGGKGLASTGLVA